MSNDRGLSLYRASTGGSKGLTFDLIFKGSHILLMVLFIVPVMFGQWDDRLLDVQFQQLNFMYSPISGYEPEVMSDIGRMVFNFMPEPEAEYVNVIATLPDGTVEPFWIIRNLFLPSADDALMPIEGMAARFPLSVLGIESGMPLEMLSIGVLISSEPISDELIPTMIEEIMLSSTMVPVGSVDIEVFDPSLDADPGIVIDISWEAYSWWDPIFGDYLASDIYYIGCRMHNIDLDESIRPGEINGCGPVSTANSMLWLRDEFESIDFDGDERSIFNQMSHLMERGDGEPVNIEQMLLGKLDFAEAHDLPLDIKYQSFWQTGNRESTPGNYEADCQNGDTDSIGQWPTWEFIQSELADSEDVEILVGFWVWNSGTSRWERRGGHFVALTGSYAVGANNYVYYKHDPEQRIEGGTVQEHSGVIPRGPALTLPGLAHKINGQIATPFIEGVISESPNPLHPGVPSSGGLDGWCDYVIRIVPPSSSLEVTFPGEPDDRYAVTVYRMNRGDPPEDDWERINYWNANGGEIKTYTNPSDLPVTILFHNDCDRIYDIGLTVVPGGASATSPSNEEMGAGFSLGWNNGKSLEFSTAMVPATDFIFGDGFALGGIPGRLSGSMTPRLTITYPIATWNERWTELRFYLDIAEVHTSGAVDVMFVGDTEVHTIEITGPGTYTIDAAGHYAAGPYDIQLIARDATDVELDCMGLLSTYSTSTEFEWLDYILDITIDQLDFTYDMDEPLYDSRIGMFNFKYDTWEETGFLNLLIREPGSTAMFWAGRNMFLPGSDIGADIEEISTRFDMLPIGIDNGTDILELEFGIAITDLPVTASDVSWHEEVHWYEPISIGEMEVGVHGTAARDTVTGRFLPDTVTIYLPFGITMEIVTNSWIGCNMENMPLDSTRNRNDWNGCAPAACSNSLQWLDDDHDEFEFPPTAREGFEQLKRLMRYNRAHGIYQGEMMKAKLDIIEAYNLPIHVKYQNYQKSGNVSSTSGNSTATDSRPAGTSWPSKDWLFSEAASGEDIEISMGYWYYKDGSWHRDGGHTIVVSGTGTIYGVPVLAFKHDAEQGDSTGVKQELTPIEVTSGGAMKLTNQGYWKKIGTTWYKVHAFVEQVVSESYDPHHSTIPNEETYGDYCQWIKRTIAPGNKLVITYPEGDHRCFNATVYRVNTDTIPNQNVRTDVWNFNGGDTREWVNTESYPVTIAIHNDDYHHESGEYVPFTVGVTQESASAGTETSPSNPEDYGGVSFGGNDGSGAEFGEPGSEGTNGNIGSNLSDVPRYWTDSTYILIDYDIEELNEYWTDGLRLVFDVAELTSPGWLFFESSTGLIDSFMIDTTGRFIADMPGVLDTTFWIQFQGGPDLEIELDAIGLPPVETVIDTVDTTASMIIDIKLEQLNLLFSEDSVFQSEIGLVTVKYMPDDTMRFFQLSALTHVGDTVGLVSNLPLPQSFWMDDTQSVSVRVDLAEIGIMAGEPAGEVTIGSELTNEPVAEPAPVPESFFDVFVVLADDNAGGFDPTSDWLGSLPDMDFFLFEPYTIEDIVYRGCAVPNIDLDRSEYPADSTYAGDWNACAPAGVANCFKWLSDEYESIDIDQTHRELLKDLSGRMGRSAESGVSIENHIQAKLDYIEDNDLNIHVKFQSYLKQSGDITSPSGRTRADNTLDDVTDSLPTWDFIKSEMDRGEDIEIGIKWNGRGGHIIVATGYMEDNRGNRYLWFKHDRDQAEEGGTIQEFDRIHVGDDGTLWLARKRAWIRHVISESPGEPFVAEIDMELLNGWNMVSNPYELPLFVPEDIVPSFFAPAYTYSTIEGAYNAADTIPQGPGFWLLMPEDTLVSLSGECLADTFTVDLQVGWNMIGLPNWVVMCADLSGYDELLLPVYLYNTATNAYDDIDCMTPGKSYWLLATEPVTVTFIRP